VKPDVILLDVSMPVLDGRGFLEEREQDPQLVSVPVVLMTGLGPRETIDRDLPMVRKPFGLDEVIDAVSRSVTVARHEPGPGPP
jgi:two-component system, sensor histidine kinase and response regulator